MKQEENVSIAAHPTEEQPNILDAPISRRGALAAFAVAAGLGISNLLFPKPALAASYWGQKAGIGQGAWDANGLLNGYAGCIKGQDPYKTMGYATGWTEWVCWANGNNVTQRLRAAMNLQIDCDYENELWYHMRVTPLMACGDDNWGTDHRLWFGDSPNDNTGYVWMDRDNKTVMKFNGILCNEEFPGTRGNGWNTGWKAYSYGTYGRWFRRARDTTYHKFKGLVDLHAIRIYNVMHYEAWAKKIDGGWVGTTFSKCCIDSNQDWFGAVVRVHATDGDEMNWDVCNASTDNSAKIYQQQFFGNLNQIFLTEFAATRGTDFADWNMRADFPIRFRPAHLPDGSKALDSSGGMIDYGGTYTPGHGSTVAFQTFNNNSSVAQAWWLVENYLNDDGSVNRPIMKDGGMVVINDATGMAVDRPGRTTTIPTSLQMYHSGYSDGSGDNRAQAWTIEELFLTGSLSVKSSTDDVVKYPDIPEIADPFDTCGPVSKTSWESCNKPTRFIYRWYASDTQDPAIIEPDAVVMGWAHIASYGDMKEGPAYRHVGTNMNDWPFESIRLWLQGSSFGGSIHYAGYQLSGDIAGQWSEECADGAPLGEGGKSLRWGAVKVWLTGEIAEHYDLEVRCHNTNIGWKTFYVTGNSLDDATVCGSLKENLRCLQVDLIPKPAGSTLMKEFDRNLGKLDLPDDELMEFDGKYLTCVAQEEFTCEKRTGGNQHQMLVHRFHGSVTTMPTLYLFNHATVVYHADGVDEDSVVLAEYPEPGPYSVNEAATAAALKDACNLNEHYGESPSTGFTGWFEDKELTVPYSGSELANHQVLNLYARNRCTVRIEYADGSLQPEDGTMYRTEPLWYKPDALPSFKLPDFSQKAERHRLDGVDLPAIGDDGEGHIALYLGERLTPSKPGAVFARLADDTWRRYTSECWLTSATGGVPQSPPSPRSGTPRSSSSGPRRKPKASPAREARYVKGRGCGPRPGFARVPYGRCA